MDVGPLAPLCPHLNAAEVRDEYHPARPVVAWLCPGCGEQLPAWFRPGASRQPPPLAPRAPEYRPPRRRVPFAAIAFPVLAVAFIAFTVTMTRLASHGTEAWNAADAQACQTWFAQGVHVPEGSGVSYMGDYVDPGYAKFTAAENALDAQMPGMNPYLAGDIQAWETDMESSYVIMHGDWGFENIPGDRKAVTGWCKENKYT